MTEKTRDPRLHLVRTNVKAGTCVMIPAGTEITLCVTTESPLRKVILDSSWFLEVTDVEPKVTLTEGGIV